MNSDSTNNELVALSVDLDGSLLSSDSLLESLFAMIRKTPFMLFMLPGWLLRGKVVLKKSLAGFAVHEVGDWPYNSAVVEHIQKAKQQNRQVFLVTAANEAIAKSVADRFGFFDGIIASNDNVNLKANNKRAALEDRFGKGNFDYIGNSSDDLPVWKMCRKGYMVGQEKSPLWKRATGVNQSMAIIPGPNPRLKTWLLTLRAQQWPKNVLLFVPLILGGQLYAQNVLNILGAFVAFCACCSLVYIMNDTLDLAHDRKHPRKRLRPFASGAISLWAAPVLAFGLVVLTVFAAFRVGMEFAFILGIYFFTNILYSVWAKRLIIIDVIILSSLYVLRVIAGGAAIGTVVSSWLLGFCLFAFLGLAFIKRFSELSVQNQGSFATAHGRGYLLPDRDVLKMMAVACCSSSVIVMALYVDSVNATRFFSRPDVLLLICPLLVYWFARVLILSSRGVMQDDPVAFAIKDKISYICAFVGLLIIVISH